MTAEKFCLKWNDYDASVTGGLQELRDQQLFLDLTLACGQEQLVAHKGQHGNIQSRKGLVRAFLVCVGYC